MLPPSTVAVLFLIAFGFVARADVTSSTQVPSPQTTVSASQFCSQAYDILIVGGGNAGLVLANRLSAPSRTNPNSSSLRVGVIEAGLYHSSDPLIDIPTAGNLLGNADIGTLIGNPKYDWGFESIPQEGLDGGIIQYPRGKVLGGSSAIHSMVWQRGSRSDYDAWASEFGNGPQWSFDSLLPYLKRSEAYADSHLPTPPLVPSPGELGLRTLLDDFHGGTGPVQVSYNNYQTALEQPAAVSLLAALSNNTGRPFPANPNPDGGDDVSVPLFGTSRTVSPTTGLRSYAASAYLDREVWGRTGLSIVTGATVSRIIFEGTTAQGVEFIDTTNGGKNVVHLADGGEVILAAGAIQSPQILELSGIGNRTLLEELGIEVVLDLPEVGENLQDHPVTLSDFSIREGVETLDWLALNRSHAELHKNLFEKKQAGALTYTASLLAPIPFDALVTVEDLHSLRSSLDASISLLVEHDKLSHMQRVQYNILRRLVDDGNVGWLEMVLVPSGGILSPPSPGKGGATVVAIQLYPFSRGSVHINSTDPLKSPLINPNFLPKDIPWDSHVLAAGMKFVRKWFSTEPISELVDSPLYPPVELHVEDSNEKWYEYMRKAVRTTNHPLGTTAMASRHLGGVVDSSLRVYGLENVRVVDAGIIPITVGVATQPTVYALAEKASDIIRADWGLDDDICPTHESVDGLTHLLREQ